MPKGGRDVTQPVWGFELAHNDGPHEGLDRGMLTTLQQVRGRSAHDIHAHTER